MFFGGLKKQKVYKIEICYEKNSASDRQFHGMFIFPVLGNTRRIY